VPFMEVIIRVVFFFVNLIQRGKSGSDKQRSTIHYKNAKAKDFFLRLLLVPAYGS
jgi:hypothetical protein